MMNKSTAACLLAAVALLSGSEAFTLTTLHSTTGVRSLQQSQAAVSSSISSSSMPVDSVWTRNKRRSSALCMSTTATEEVETKDAKPAEGAETYEFQAEVSRVMDIIINSLYSNRDVFLRELVSNAADACDKKRFLDVQGTASEGPGLRIRLSADKEKKTLTIEDTGIGMSKAELINNLGKIAQSGTAKFMEALGKGDADISLIGQFGVGFYSGFLVADKMTVVTKSAEGEQYKWESASGSSYTVAPDPDGTPIEGSGTRVILHLKEDAEEYLDDYKVKELAKKYSEFVSFPIEVWSEQTKYEEVPDPDAEVKEGEPPKMKTVSKTGYQWVTTNKVKPIWMRNPKDVTEEEYNEFYKTTFKAWDELAAHTHFSLEGQVEFRAMLFLPSVLPYELSRNMFDETSRNMRLYVKRVFINDKFEELLPRWLLFLRGVVDSEDLPLNVGREILQKSKMLSIINKRLVRKALDMIKGIEQDKDKKKWESFQKNFGKYLKVGIVEDADSKDELAKLARFSSSKSEHMTLPEYVARMPEGQKVIYYVAAESRAQAMMSPALEKAKMRGFEVVFLTDALDELTAQSLQSFGDFELVDLAKENVEGMEDEKEREEKETKNEELATFREWLKDVIGKDKISKVEVSTRLVDSPATLVQGAYGMSPTMQRYMRAQAMAMGEEGSLGQQNVNLAVLELNTNHPIIKDLQAKFELARDSPATLNAAMLVYDVAALTGGYSIDEPADFAARVTKMMMGAAGFGEMPQTSSSKKENKEESKEDKPMETVDAEVV